MKKSLKLIRSDALEELSKMESDSIDLIFTSPPYAQQRKSTYGGIQADEYVDCGFFPFREKRFV